MHWTIPRRNTQIEILLPLQNLIQAPKIKQLETKWDIHTWYFSCISLTETENSVMVQLSVLNSRFRKAENNPSSFMQASASNLYSKSNGKNERSTLVRNQSRK